MPEGFSVSIFADDVASARMMEYAPNGDLFVSQTGANSIIVLRDTNNDGTPDMRTIYVQGPKNSHTIPFADFHLLPGNTPHRETVLEPGDLITHVTLPAPVKASKQLYLKLRDRASYEFALASAAVVISVAGGNVTHARIALGGVGVKPWRSQEAEAALVGQPADQANFRKAAEAAMRNAKPQSQNAFKIELAKRCLTHALQMAVAS